MGAVGHVAAQDDLRASPRTTHDLADDVLRAEEGTAIVDEDRHFERGVRPTMTRSSMATTTLVGTRRARYGSVAIMAASRAGGGFETEGWVQLLPSKIQVSFR